MIAAPSGAIPVRRLPVGPPTVAVSIVIIATSAIRFFCGRSDRAESVLGSPRGAA
jgi:hypothetical protein